MKNWIHRLAVSTAAALAVVLALALGATPASASFTCASNSACIWSGANGTGSKVTLGPGSDFSCHTLGLLNHQDVSYYINTSGHNLGAFSDAFCQTPVGSWYAQNAWTLATTDVAYRNVGSWYWF